MDSRIWRFYPRTIVKAEVEVPFVLMVNNISVHVSEESEDIVAGLMFSTLHPLPHNSTSKYQPLDVGVM